MGEKGIEVWSKIKSVLKDVYGEEIYDTYFSQINEVYKETNNNVVLVVDNLFYKTRIQSNYLNKMNLLIEQLFSSSKTFALITKAEVEEEETKKKDNSSKSVFSKTNSFGLNPNYTFSTFVVGDSNRFAHRFATLAADQLASVANPVYMFGDVGLGKTHLMQAIGNYIVESRPELRILYIRTQDFVEEYVKCGTREGYDKFSEKFSNVDVLLVDDVQFLESKKQCQLEFFKLFEKLLGDKKLVVLTSDKKAADLREIMSRLTSRFEWGMSLDINKPDKAHRVSILKAKLRQETSNPDAVSEEVIDFIATVCENNIRELEGALKRVLFYCEAFGYECNINNAKEALKNTINLNNNLGGNSVAPSEEIKKMFSVVCSYFKIPQDTLFSNSRKKEVVYARQVCWYVLRSKFDLTFQKIGDIFNGKDHSTIMHGFQLIETDVKKGTETKNNVENILRKMGKDPNAL